MSLNEALKVKKENEGELLKIEGVTGVGLGKSIIIYVKKYTSQMAALLPKTLDNFPICIIQTGTIIPLSLMRISPVHAIYAERTGRFRPTVPGGVSIGHPEVTAGTLGCRAVDKTTGKVLGLSNNHVCALQWGEAAIGQIGDSILQPGPYDGGVDPTDKIGELDRWVPVTLEGDNLVDAAAFTSEMVKQEVLEIGRPDRLADPQPNMKIFKSGRSSGVTYGKILDVNASVKVEGWGTVLFTDQITVTPAILSPGDSGSWCGEMDTFKTVGLGHAGSSELSVICKGANIEELLGVEIVSPMMNNYLPWYTVVGVWGSVFGLGQAVVGSLKVAKERGRYVV